MPLIPHEERELLALAAELRRTDPVLARALGAMPPWPRARRTRLVGLVVLLGGLVAGRVPLAVGLRAGLPWLAGVGAVLICALPFITLYALTRCFPPTTARPHPSR